MTPTYTYNSPEQIAVSNVTRPYYQPNQVIGPPLYNQCLQNTQSDVPLAYSTSLQHPRRTPVPSYSQPLGVNEGHPGPQNAVYSSMTSSGGPCYRPESEGTLPESIQAQYPQSSEQATPTVAGPYLFSSPSSTATSYTLSSPIPQSFHGATYAQSPQNRIGHEAGQGLSAEETETESVPRPYITSAVYVILTPPNYTVTCSALLTSLVFLAAKVIRLNSTLRQQIQFH